MSLESHLAYRSTTEPIPSRIPPRILMLLLLALAGCNTDTTPSRPQASEPPRQARPPGPATPTNLLLLTLDTTRADRVGSYGYAQATTPHLDALAARGTRFENAIAPVALTRPAHATMLTISWTISLTR